MRTIHPLLAIVLLSVSTGALAHHPGSHATREGGNRVRIDAVALATDNCTRIDAIRLGTPAVATAPPGLTPVTARLKRGDGTCVAAANAVRAEQVLELPIGVKQIFLYVEGSDGVLVSTERVPVE